ncbi:MAG: hypothetical protein LIO96_04380 [Lachnospiraceae bacterium]|nr:hypothetical protein [Lachnospiraceae bacterium]
MTSREDIWRDFVEHYEIEVPQDAVEREEQFIATDIRHRMQYDAMSGGGLHLNPRGEIVRQQEEIHKVAVFEVKSELVMKEILRAQQFTVTREELEAEAAELAKRQNSSIEMIRNFFGDDLALLERDVKERKAVDWVCAHADS